MRPSINGLTDPATVMCWCKRLLDPSVPHDMENRWDGYRPPDDVSGALSLVRGFIEDSARLQACREIKERTGEWPDWFRDADLKIDLYEYAKCFLEDPSEVHLKIARTAAWIYLQPDWPDLPTIIEEVGLPSWMTAAAADARMAFKSLAAERQEATRQRERPLEMRPHPGIALAHLPGVAGQPRRALSPSEARLHLEGVAASIESEIRILDLAAASPASRLVDPAEHGARSAFAAIEYLGALDSGTATQQGAGMRTFKFYLQELRPFALALYRACRNPIAHGLGTRRATFHAGQSSLDGRDRVVTVVPTWSDSEPEAVRCREQVEHQQEIEVNFRVLLVEAKAAAIAMAEVIEEPDRLEHFNKAWQEVAEPRAVTLGTQLAPKTLDELHAEPREVDTPPLEARVAVMSIGATERHPSGRPLTPRQQLEVYESILRLIARPTLEELIDNLEPSSAVALRRAIDDNVPAWSWLPRSLSSEAAGEVRADHVPPGATAASRVTNKILALIPHPRRKRGRDRADPSAIEHLEGLRVHLDEVGRRLLPLSAAPLVNESIGTHWSMIPVRIGFACLDHLCQLTADSEVEKTDDQNLQQLREAFLATWFDLRYAAYAQVLGAMFRYPAFHLFGPRNVTIEEHDVASVAGPLVLSYCLIDSENRALDFDFEGLTVEHLRRVSGAYWSWAAEGRRVRVPAHFLLFSPKRFLRDSAKAVERLTRAATEDPVLSRRIADRLAALSAPADWSGRTDAVQSMESLIRAGSTVHGGSEQAT
ncbi:hypothetical protein Pla86_47640 [Planctomycetes bacterium Pla86]|uniref:Uncharacterized protein n=2 Tax=Engelhardtia mirabilis TaxID=2528011 RepID=A0A518BRP1_9BACT|nr:hypothetical protein Pla133_47660 [Planctomycetes bacterium Pla133]QDV03971.1 hypothetical protein Pla86_47640 [Planctomycetes bacterium Pla86]